MLAIVVALLVSSQDAVAYPKRVERLLDKGQVHQAIKLLERASDRNPADVRVWLDLANIYGRFTAVEDPRKELLYLRKAERAAQGLGESDLSRDLIGPRLAQLETEIDRLDWEHAQLAHTEPAGKEYLALHPHGSYRREAPYMIQDVRAEAALAPQTAAAYEAYLDSADGGEYHDRGRVVVELHRLAWLEALARGTADAVVGFLRRYPENEYTDSAFDRLYSDLTRSGTEAAFLEYLRRTEQWAATQMVAQTRRKAYEGLLDLVGEADEAGLEAWLEHYPAAPNRAAAYDRLLALVPRAGNELAEFIDSHPDATNLGEAHEALLAARVSQGRESVGEYLSRYPDGPLRHAALDALFEFSKAEGAESLSTLIDDHPQWTRRGEALDALFEFSKAEGAESLNTLIDAYPQWSRRGDALQAHYEAYVEDGSEASYRAYREQWPDRRFQATDADGHIWSSFYDPASMPSMKRYLDRYPDGPFASEATANLHRLAYDAAVAKDTPEALLRFARDYPGATQAAGAKSQASRLHDDRCKKTDYNAWWSADKKSCQCSGDYRKVSLSSGSFKCQLTQAARERMQREQQRYEDRRACKHVYVGKVFEAKGGIGIFETTWTYRVIGYNVSAGRATIRSGRGYDAYDQEVDCADIPD